MFNSDSTPFPEGVRLIAALFAFCGIYLAILAIILLVSPGAISLTAAAPLLFGLELAGPYMFLLLAMGGGAIAWGLMRLNNIMRHAAVLAACAGIVMLIPSVSGAVVSVRLKGLVLGGLGIIVRAMVAWYLSQGHIADEFKTERST
ncbi:MAG: hypothetical protein DMG80_06330 [Acidobacteria bacterium]|nr:MAG: hypothetical protein DMG80_06330 [Acidobacteriota bacterium]